MWLKQVLAEQRQRQRQRLYTLMLYWEVDAMYIIYERHRRRHPSNDRLDYMTAGPSSSAVKAGPSVNQGRWHGTWWIQPAAQGVSTGPAKGPSAHPVGRSFVRTTSSRWHTMRNSAFVATRFPRRRFRFVALPDLNVAWYKSARISHPRCSNKVCLITLR